MITDNSRIPTQQQNAGEERKTFESIGVQIPQVYLPKEGIDLQKWAVIACDQFTSQPEYWKAVEKLVGDAPSTLNLILPELYLEGPEEEVRVCRAQDSMRAYLESGLLEQHEGIIYVERQAAGKSRKGIILCLDLEKYNYNKDSQSLIRATEGTIVERIPPRMRIRVGADLELPHILVLIDDPQGSVIAPLEQLKDKEGALKKLYDFDLMLNSGHLAGYLIQDAEVEASIIRSLECLADPGVFAARYGVSAEESVLLFAMGDGNHSLATAKNTWERIKPVAGLDHPARYALVEIENVHDEGLEFEPIHRVLFNLKSDIFQAMQDFYGASYRYYACSGCEEMNQMVEEACGNIQAVGVVYGDSFGVVELENPATNLPVGTFQPFLDAYLKQGGAEKIDYVHGQDVVCELGSQPGNIGFYLPCMDKSDLFKTVVLDGALPRKTFSMGEAREKRFYMESRKITP